MFIELRDGGSDAVIGTMTDLVGTLWANGMIVDEEGETNYLIELERGIVLTGDPNQLKLNKVAISASITHTYYASRMPVSQLQGFYNPVERSLTTKGLGMGPVSFDELISKGRIITKEEAASCSATMGFDVADAWEVRDGFELPPMTVQKDANLPG